jgi:hypothetical protein
MSDFKCWPAQAKSRLSEKAPLRLAPRATPPHTNVSEKRSLLKCGERLRLFSLHYVVTDIKTGIKVQPSGEPEQSASLQSECQKMKRMQIQRRVSINDRR